MTKKQRRALAKTVKTLIDKEQAESRVWIPLPLLIELLRALEER